MNKLKTITVSSWVAIVDACVLVCGLLLWVFGKTAAWHSVSFIALIILALPLWWEILSDVWHRKFGVDLIAGLAIL